MTMRIQRKKTEELFHELTDDETIERSRSIAWALREESAAKLRVEGAKGQVKAWEKRVTELHVKVADLGEVICEGKEMRPTEVVVVLFDAANAILTIRTDTGEVIGAEALTDEDGSLSFTAPDNSPTTAVRDIALEWQASGGGFDSTIEDDPVVTTDLEAGGLAQRVKAVLDEQAASDAVERGFRWIELGELHFPDEHSATLESTIWALIHTGEISDQDDVLVSAIADGLHVDVGAMLEACPALGTEKGPADGRFKTIPLNRVTSEAESLANAVSVKIFASGGATRADIFDTIVLRFEGENDGVPDDLAERIDAALVELVDSGQVEPVGTEVDGEEVVRYMPPGQDLDALDTAGLKEVYAREVGHGKGRYPKPATMKKRITEKREDVAAAPDPAED